MKIWPGALKFLSVVGMVKDLGPNFKNNFLNFFRNDCYFEYRVRHEAVPRIFDPGI